MTPDLSLGHSPEDSPESSTESSLEHCRALDAADPLRARKAAFTLPDGVIYLDGNSLGAQPKTVPARVMHMLEKEWATDLIKSWNSADWVNLPQTVGRKIAPLIGADPASVIMTDSTSVNIFKAVAAACHLTPEHLTPEHLNLGRRKIISEPGNFPTDLYMLDGIQKFLKGDYQIVIKERDAIIDAIDEETACVLLTHVHYITSSMWDMHALTKAAHSKGAKIVWDLSHSVGAVPLDLSGAAVDFAVGCGYKYLNGGPGAPAFIYVAPKHIEAIEQPLSGWFAHRRPFDFVDSFESAPDIRAMQVGTPVVSAAIILDEALKVWDGVDMQAVRTKSLALTDMFAALMQDHLSGYGFTPVTPQDHQARGSHISFRHPDGYAIMQALIDHGVIGDFRAPEFLRFGITPLYIGFEDVYRAVMTLRDIMTKGLYTQKRYQARNAVT